MENKTQQDLRNVLQTAETEWLMGMNHRKTHTSQTPSFRFTLFRADFSWLFHCTKHLFMLEGMFMLITCSSSCRSCYEWSKKAAASKQNPQEASMHPLKTCFWLGFYLLLFSRFVFTEMSKTSLTWGPTFCTIICLPGLKLDNKKVRYQQNSYHWCKAALKRINLKAPDMKIHDKKKTAQSSLKALSSCPKYQNESKRS